MSDDPDKLADFDNPLVKEKATQLTEGAHDTGEKLQRLFLYVRDGIKFGFPLKGDFVKASETIESGIGQCNTKTTLFLALCKAAGIPSRIHFSLIRKDIQKGIFTGIGYALLPPLISHSWLEVEIDGQWQKVDAYINDDAFYKNGLALLRRKGWDAGYSISRHGQFMQMGAVVGDHGTWDDPIDYYRTDKYVNRPSGLRPLIYKIVIGGINKRVERIRNG
ncbi:MAG TPA: transglutaminase-like domain-containing protein [Candidatus Paceibacterota bacterium]|nr:transglutaminase-like domain-containing protein [Candidatus Paceibacterota bacterium]